MKNFFRFSIAMTLSVVMGISFLYSCSSDSVESETVEAANPIGSQVSIAKLSAIDLKTAKTMYESMTKTQDWADYALSRNSFATKMKDNTVFFMTKADYMNWINSNLSSTSFQSIRDFETAFDDMTGKYQVLIDQNTSLFNYIKQADPDQYFSIAQPGFDPELQPTGNTGCEIVCGANLAAAYVSARSNYNQDMEAITRYGNSNLAAAVESRYEAYILSARIAFAACISGC